MEDTPEHLLSQALSELSSCLSRVFSIPRNLTGYAELFQAVVAWAAPGPEPVTKQKVPDRAIAAARAFLSLLGALRIMARDPLNADSTAGAESPTPASPGNVAESPEEPSVTPNEEASTSGSSTMDSSGVTFPDPQRILICATSPLLLLCGAHIQEKPWTNSFSSSLAEQLLQTLLRIWNCKSVAELLKEPNRTEPKYRIFNQALGLLAPRLRKDTWESHPEARIVFSWLLFQVPRPWLTDFLARVMPPSLLFSDDYKPENQVLGVQCLNHIIRNVPAADLRQYNRAMVVYHALRNHLYTTDPEVIEVVLPCLLDLFPILHKPPPPMGSFQKDDEDPADHVMQLILTHMEMENKVILRRLYAINLPAFQEKLGLRVVRHMKRLMRVIVSYLEVCDGPEETTRLCILQTLHGTIKHAWPRLTSRIPLLVKSLLKFIHDVSADPSQHPKEIREDLLYNATECLVLLDRCSKGQVKIALKEIPSICKEPDMVKCIKRVLQDGKQ